MKINQLERIIENTISEAVSNRPNSFASNTIDFTVPSIEQIVK